MTLVLSMLNSEYAVQLSDRRLSSARGTEDDESNKAVVVVTLTARVVMGYSGLARVGNFDIFETVKDLLVAAAPPDYRWGRMVYRFAERLSEEFRHPTIRGLPPDQRRASFHFVGHMRTDPPTPTITYVSNWDDPANRLRADPPADEFKVSGGVFTHPTGFPRIVMLGAHAHLGEEDFQPLMDLLRDRCPPKLLVDKGVALMRQWADDPRAGGTIGKQLSSVIAPAAGSRWAAARYHTNVPRSTVYMVDNVYALPGKVLQTRGGVVGRVDGGTVAVPPAGRNKPCPCGSGKKYRQCHSPAATTPMIVRLENVSEQ
jgi:hypothetical protein